MGQVKLKNARVLVIGAGGLGCPLIQYLASCGIGTIGVVDFDVIEHSNLHRQILYGPEDVGKKKAEIAKSRTLAQNPDVEIILHDTALTDENAEELIALYDLVIDGCDNFLTRYTVNDVCVSLSKTFKLKSFERRSSIVAWIAGRSPTSRLSSTYWAM